MRLQLLPEFIQFSIPAEFLSIVFSLPVLLFFFLGIPEYTDDGHADDEEKGQSKTDPVSFGKKDQVIRIGRIVHDEVDEEFAQGIHNQAEDHTDDENVPVPVAVGEVVTQDIADDPAGGHQQYVGYQAVDYCNI